MTLKNCERLYQVYLARGDKKNAEIFANRIMRKGGKDPREKLIEKPKEYPKMMNKTFKAGGKNGKK